MNYLLTVRRNILLQMLTVHCVRNHPRRISCWVQYKFHRIRLANVRRHIYCKVWICVCGNIKLMVNTYRAVFIRDCKYGIVCGACSCWCYSKLSVSTAERAIGVCMAAVCICHAPWAFIKEHHIHYYGIAQAAVCSCREY